MINESVEALWYAVDIPGAIKIAYRNFGQVGTGIISPGIDGRHPDLSRYFPKRDIAAGQETPCGGWLS